METLYCVCEDVLCDTKPIFFVCHEIDGGWQFLCGSLHQGETPKLIGIEHLLERDASLRDTLKLPLGWDAERADTSSAWQSTERPGDDAS